MEKPFNITFPNALPGRAIRIGHHDDLLLVLRELGFQIPKLTVVLIGGAASMSEATLDDLHPVFIDTIIPLIESLQAAVIDGGTDSGVMGLVGRCRGETSAKFPLIGVSAIGTVNIPGSDHVPQNPDAASLDTNHTHFVFVPGSEWGDESPWISRIAGALAGDEASITLVINGGSIAMQDVSMSIESRRPVIALDKTGRTADSLAAAARGETSDQTTQYIASSGLLKVVDVFDNPDSLSQAIEDILSHNT